MSTPTDISRPQPCVLVICLYLFIYLFAAHERLRAKRQRRLIILGICVNQGRKEKKKHHMGSIYSAGDVLCENF